MNKLNLLKVSITLLFLSSFLYVVYFNVKFNSINQLKDSNLFSIVFEILILSVLITYLVYFLFFMIQQNITISKFMPDFITLKDFSTLKSSIAEKFNSLEYNTAIKIIKSESNTAKKFIDLDSSLNKKFIDLDSSLDEKFNSLKSNTTNKFITEKFTRLKSSIDDEISTLESNQNSIVKFLNQNLTRALRERTELRSSQEESNDSIAPIKLKDIKSEPNVEKGTTKVGVQVYFLLAVMIFLSQMGLFLVVISKVRNLLKLILNLSLVVVSKLRNLLDSILSLSLVVVSKLSELLDSILEDLLNSILGLSSDEEVLSSNEEVLRIKEQDFLTKEKALLYEERVIIAKQKDVIDKIRSTVYQGVNIISQIRLLRDELAGLGDPDLGVGLRFRELQLITRENDLRNIENALTLEQMNLNDHLRQLRHQRYALRDQRKALRPQQNALRAQQNALRAQQEEILDLRLDNRLVQQNIHIENLEQSFFSAEVTIQEIDVVSSKQLIEGFCYLLPLFYIGYSVLSETFSIGSIIKISGGMVVINLLRELELEPKDREEPMEINESNELEVELNPQEVKQLVSSGLEIFVFICLIPLFYAGFLILSQVPSIA